MTALITVPQEITHTEYLQALNAAKQASDKLLQLIETTEASIHYAISSTPGAESVLDHIDSLEHQLALQGRGMVVESVEELEGPEYQDTTKTHNAICVRVWKQLAKKLHPDYGGDPEIFNIVRKAYEARDIVTMQYYAEQFNNVAPSSYKDLTTALRLQVVNTEARISVLKSSAKYRIGRMVHDGTPTYLLHHNVLLYLDHVVTTLYKKLGVIE